MNKLGNRVCLTLVALLGIAGCQDGTTPPSAPELGPSFSGAAALTFDYRGW